MMNPLSAMERIIPCNLLSNKRFGIGFRLSIDLNRRVIHAGRFLLRLLRCFPRGPPHEFGKGKARCASRSPEQLVVVRVESDGVRPRHALLHVLDDRPQGK